MYSISSMYVLPMGSSVLHNVLHEVESLCKLGTIFFWTFVYGGFLKLDLCEFNLCFFSF